MAENYDLQTLIKQAKEAYEAEEYLQAAQGFEAAAHASELSGDALNAAEMQNNRSVALLKARNPEAALEAARGTDLIFAQAGDLRRQGMALGNQAAALDDLRRDEESIAAYQQSAALFEQAGEKDMRALVLRRVSAIHYRQKNTPAALSTMLDALNCQTRLSLQDRILKGLLKIVARLSTRG
ncbi:MAG TPA: hypothetical protein PLA25_11115 [Anaerolineaceae bacterium]|nr:hypothetical protein [Longilinea sp.]HNZ13738.1 hypothetical protein [Anaerolineaceae bacterium]HOG79638.1 hypothetical protein [Anaerolineaceae bacterium]HQN44676.1 hypothetical protein [Anaerolineaceae bacterium]